MENENNKASSIGIVGAPYKDEKNDRMKWLCVDPIENKETLNNRIEEFKGIYNANGVSRVTSRFIINNSLLHKPIEYVEAVVPLEERFSDYSLVYLGKNKKERYEPQSLILEEIASACNINRERSPKNYQEAIDRISREGYFLECATKIEADPKNILELYTEAYEGRYTFALDENNVTQLLTNPGNIKAVVKNKEGKVLSISVAEVSEPMVIAGKQFRFSELSDAATYRTCLKNGFYTATTAILLKKLAEKEIDLVYGEARSAHKAVNVVFRKNGLKYMGILHKHCEINGPKDFPEEGKYENLNVWAIGITSLKGKINYDSQTYDIEYCCDK